MVAAPVVAAAEAPPPLTWRSPCASSPVAVAVAVVAQPVALVAPAVVVVAVVVASGSAAMVVAVAPVVQLVVALGLQVLVARAPKAE